MKPVATLAALLSIMLLATAMAPIHARADQPQAATIQTAPQRLADAQRLINAGRHDQALDILSQLAENEQLTGQQRHEAWRSKALLLVQLDRQHEAAAAFTQAGSIEDVAPTVAANQLLRAGDIYRRLGEYDQAVDVFSRVTGMSAGWKREADAQGRIREVDALRYGEPGFWIDPYVPRVKQNTAAIVWVSRPGVDQGQLTIAHNHETRTWQSQTTSITAHDMTKGVRHLVEIDNLEPHTRYHYTVQSGDNQRTGSFLTPAAPDQDAPIHFLAYGDTQDRPHFHAQTAAIMAQQQADFVLHTGDLVGSGNRWGHWKVQFFEPANQLFNHAPIWPAIGNHDGSALFDQLFLREETLYTSFRYANAEFFILSSYRSGSIGSTQRQEQLDWLDNALAQSDATWTFVVLHHPMLYPGEHFPQQPSDQSGWGQTDFLPIVQRHEVDIVFSGHYHVYQRLTPVADPGKKPVMHITTGGAASVGGDHGHDGQAPDALQSPLVEIGVRALHYCDIKIDGNELTLKAILRDGTILDEFTLIKTDGRFQQEIESQAVTTEYAIRHISPFHQQRFETLERAEAGEKRIPLAQAWRFRFDPRQQGTQDRWYEPQLDDSTWTWILIGDFWQNTAPGIAHREQHEQNYEGLAWYRTRFNIPRDHDTEKAKLWFGRIDAAAQVYLNGQLLLDRPYPFQDDPDSYKTPFKVEIPLELLRRDRPNTLAVQVDSVSGAGGIAQPVELRLLTAEVSELETTAADR